MRLSREDLNEFGRGRLEDDFQGSARRGKRGSLDDFADGWMALAYRHKLWSYFTPEARARLEHIAA